MNDLRERIVASNILCHIKTMARGWGVSPFEVLDVIRSELLGSPIPEEVEVYVLKAYAERPGGSACMRVVRKALGHYKGELTMQSAPLCIEQLMRLCVVADAADTLTNNLYIFDEAKASDEQLCFDVCAKHTEYKTKQDYMAHMSELISEALGA